MNAPVNPRAAWWAQSFGFPATLEGVHEAFKRHGTCDFMAFISRCTARAESQGFKPVSDTSRFDDLVKSEAISDTIKRFAA